MSQIIITDSQFNIGWLCTGRQCTAGLGEKLAMRWVSPRFERQDFSFADLDRLSNRFANVLASLGVGKGEVIFTFLPKAPEQFTAFLGGYRLIITIQRLLEVVQIGRRHQLAAVGQGLLLGKAGISTSFLFQAM